MYLRPVDTFHFMDSKNFKITDDTNYIHKSPYYKLLKDIPYIKDIKYKQAEYEYVCSVINYSKFLVANVHGKDCLLGLYIASVDKDKMFKYKYDVYHAGKEEVTRFIGAAEHLGLTPFIQGIVLIRAKFEQGLITENAENALVRGHFPMDNGTFLRKYIDAKLNLSIEEEKPLTWPVYSEIIGKEKGWF